MVLDRGEEARRYRPFLRRAHYAKGGRGGRGPVTIAIDPAPFRGVLPLPLLALKSSSAVLGNPLNLHPRRPADL